MARFPGTSLLPGASGRCGKARKQPLKKIAVGGETMFDEGVFGLKRINTCFVSELAGSRQPVAGIQTIAQDADLFGKRDDFRHQVVSERVVVRWATTLLFVDNVL